MKAMILAAGRGERLLPLTATTPKPLLEIGGETLIERHLGALAAAGVADVVINVSHLAEAIERHLGDRHERGMRIAYSREPDGPLETAGGIIAALPLLGTEPFVVVNGDIWTDFPFAALPRTTAAAHLVLVPNPAHHEAGDFDLDGDILTRGVRNSATYAGIAVFHPQFFQGLAGGRRALAPLLFAAAAARRLQGQLYRGSWFDIGTAERLDAARRFAASRRRP